MVAPAVVVMVFGAWVVENGAIFALTRCRNKQPTEAERNRAQVKIYSEKLRREQMARKEEALVRQQESGGRI